MHNNKFQMKNGALVDDAGSHDDDPNKICTPSHAPERPKKKLDIIRLKKICTRKKNKICFANNKHTKCTKVYIYYVLQLDLLIWPNFFGDLWNEEESFVDEESCYYYLQTFLSTNSYKICKTSSPPNEDLFAWYSTHNLTNNNNKGCVTLWPYQFTLKTILMQKKNYGNSNISSCKKYIYKKL